MGMMKNLFDDYLADEQAKMQEEYELWISEQEAKVRDPLPHDFNIKEEDNESND